MERTTAAFLYSIMGVVFIMSSIIFTVALFNTEKLRAQYLLSDEVTKDSVSLNISAASGSRLLKSSEIIMDVYECPLEVRVFVEGTEISQSVRSSLKKHHVTIFNYFDSSKTYAATYEYDINGNLSSINYILEGEQAIYE